MSDKQSQSSPRYHNPADITQVLQSIRNGEESTNALIPMVYDELRQIAATRLAGERPGHTLQATALVHEAYLKLLNPNTTWTSRRHFFGAAAEAMRRILIEGARRKNTQKRGHNPVKQDGLLEQIPVTPPMVDFLDLNDALIELEKLDPETAEVVKLRYFAGLTMNQIARAMEFSPRKADNIWAFAKVWLYNRLH